MRQKPLKTLLNKVGHRMIADFLGVDISVVYRWEYKEAGKKGGRIPSTKHALRIAKIAEMEGVDRLTIEYLARL